jgi:large subunit ribosomal protein L5
MVPRLKEHYKNNVVPALAKEFGKSNRMAVPRLSKIVISMGLGKSIAQEALLDSAVAELAVIAGQRPIVTRSRKAISNFKLRQGMKIGAKVTLRGARMWEFLDRLISLAIPRVKDFRGLAPSGFDGRGSYNMGLSEQTVFPEISPDKVTSIQGMNISMVTTARTDEEARRLLVLLGMPFRS